VSDEQSFAQVVYRWHEIMFRLDELDETEAVGMTEDESSALAGERASLQRELEAVEGQLGQARVSGLRASHELDRSYARLMRQVDEETEDEL
jgi:hypothetical protein